jgi:hypothetical protein
MMPVTCRRSFVAAFALLASITAGQARETAPPLEVEPIGFSADGRYFAYEELLVGDGNGGPAVMIHVLDRRTNKSAPGFPFGLPESDEEDAANPGKDKWQRLGLKEADFEDAANFEKLRAEIRKRAAEKLSPFDITARPRRIAGTPFTQLAPAATTLSFQVHRELLGGIPDQQMTYRLRVQMQPEGQKCFGVTPKTMTKLLSLTLESLAPQPHGRAPKLESTSRTNVTFATNDECPQGARISDVFAGPRKEGEKQPLVAMVFVNSWRSHADTSRFVPMFIEVE